MRVPYYLAQYYQTLQTGPGRKSTVVPVMIVAVVLLLYVGALAGLLLGNWS